MEQGRSNLGTILITIVITAGVVGGGMYMWQKNQVNVPTNVNESKGTMAQEGAATTADTGATISGTLTYPADGGMPQLKVCAADVQSKKESCVKNTGFNYTIPVQPGTYLVYAEASPKFKAYYTKCDTYDNKFIPECNSNAGDGTVNWQQDTFVCVKDKTCKAAFTPLPISVASQQKVEIKKIEQGWYVPCSRDRKTCDDPAFDVWDDYLK